MATITRRARTKIELEIRQRNRAFKKATKAQKRVLIAQDVIAQIKANRLMPIMGSWVVPKTTNNKFMDINDKFGDDASVRELFLENKIPKCGCCALGAVFMSCTLYNNKTTTADFTEETSWDFSDNVEGGKFSNGLTNVFSRSQLMLIEMAYEGGEGAFMAKKNKRDSTAACWQLKIPNDTKRLIAIMQNIIDHDGTFVPEALDAKDQVPHKRITR